MIYMKVMGRTHNEVRIDSLRAEAHLCVFGENFCGPRKSYLSSLDGGSAAKISFLEFAQVSLLTGLVLKVSVFVSARAVLRIFYIGKLTQFFSVLA